MITIEYDSIDGTPVADGNAEDFVLSLKEKSTVKVSTENVFLATRLFVKKKKISHETIRFKYKDKFIFLNSDGRFTANPPDGFCSFEISKIRELM